LIFAKPLDIQTNHNKAIKFTLNGGIVLTASYLLVALLFIINKSICLRYIATSSSQPTSVQQQ
ncbi:MAG: hypothetical protein ACRC7P_04940, partial [Enterovibrio sp.]